MEYNIPKISRPAQDSLVRIDRRSREFRDLMKHVASSYLWVKNSQMWSPEKAWIVNNSRFERDFREKKNEMKRQEPNRITDGDIFAFTTDFDTKSKIVLNGVMVKEKHVEIKDKKMKVKEKNAYGRGEGKNVKNKHADVDGKGKHLNVKRADVNGDAKHSKDKHSGSNDEGAPVHVLGDADKGVYLVRHADVILQNAEVGQIDMLVCKVLIGRVKHVLMSARGKRGLEPTPNYDTHVTSVPAKPTDNPGTALIRSQIYLYEYNEEALPSKRPRNCLPYAFITFHKEPIKSTCVSPWAAFPSPINAVGSQKDQAIYGPQLEANSEPSDNDKDESPTQEDNQPTGPIKLDSEVLSDKLNVIRFLITRSNSRLKDIERKRKSLEEEYKVTYGIASLTPKEVEEKKPATTPTTPTRSPTKGILKLYQPKSEKIGDKKVKFQPDVNVLTFFNVNNSCSTTDVVNEYPSNRGTKQTKDDVINDLKVPDEVEKSIASIHAAQSGSEVLKILEGTLEVMWKAYLSLLSRETSQDKKSDEQRNLEKIRNTTDRNESNGAGHLYHGTPSNKSKESNKCTKHYIDRGHTQTHCGVKNEDTNKDNGRRHGECVEKSPFDNRQMKRSQRRMGKRSDRFTRTSLVAYTLDSGSDSSCSASDMSCSSSSCENSPSKQSPRSERSNSSETYIRSPKTSNADLLNGGGERLQSQCSDMHVEAKHKHQHNNSRRSGHSIPNTVVYKHNDIRGKTKEENWKQSDPRLSKCNPGGHQQDKNPNAAKRNSSSGNEGGSAYGNQGERIHDTTAYKDEKDEDECQNVQTKIPALTDKRECSLDEFMSLDSRVRDLYRSFMWRYDMRRNLLANLANTTETSTRLVITREVMHVDRVLAYLHVQIEALITALLLQRYFPPETLRVPNGVLYPEESLTLQWPLVNRQIRKLRNIRNGFSVCTNDVMVLRQEIINELFVPSLPDQSPGNNAVVLKHILREMETDAGASSALVNYVRAKVHSLSLSSQTEKK